MDQPHSDDSGHCLFDTQTGEGLGRITAMINLRAVLPALVDFAALHESGIDPERSNGGQFCCDAQRGDVVGCDPQV